jgi:hypothetical protein
MAEQNKKALAEPIKIFYQGRDAEAEAKSVYDDILQQFHIEISPPRKILSRSATLGIEELIITVILAKMTEITLEAIWDYLKKWFQNRHNEVNNNITLNVQIVLKKDNSDIGKRFPFQIKKGKPIDLEGINLI